jgi:hypothetical protein
MSRIIVVVVARVRWLRFKQHHAEQANKFARHNEDL